MVLEKLEEETEEAPEEVPERTSPHQGMPLDLEACLGKGTYKTIAERSGLSPRHVGRILNGQVRKPGLETIQKISQASGIDLDVLIEYIEKKRKSGKHQYSSNRLSKSQIEEIRSLKGKATTRSIAKEMQISRTTVSSIWNAVI